MYRKLLVACGALLLGIAGLPNLASASRGIVDGGDFFGDAKQAASTTIDALYEKHHREIRIETFAAVPQDQQAKLKQFGTDAFFKSWLIERAKAEHVDGVFILICRQPGMIKVGINEATRKTKFNEADREALWKLIKRRFDQKDFDAGLTDGLKYISDRFEAHGGTAVAKVAPPAANSSHGPGTFTVPETAGTHEPREANRQPSRGHAAPPVHRADNGGSGIMSLIIFGAVVFVAFLVIRSLFRAMSGGGGNYGGVGTPTTGGGFGTGFFSGLFGAVAGNALYDTFFRGHHSSGWDSSASASETHSSFDGGVSPSDSGSSSDGWSVNDGGSFGDMSSGGGGDFGGGFGGGDFGGGGSDF